MKIRHIPVPEKIECYVKEHVGENGEIQASQLPMENAEDFVKIIYVRLYGQRKNMGDTVETGEEIEQKGYRFRNFTIRLKG